MPDVKVRHPRGMLDATGVKEIFKREAQLAVAAALACYDYNSEPVNMGPDDVDIELIPYNPDDVTAGVPVRVEVMGYNYPSRMIDIETRLARIKEALNRMVRQFLEVGKDLPTVSVSFIPMPDGCWV